MSKPKIFSCLAACAMVASGALSVSLITDADSQADTMPQVTLSAPTTTLTPPTTAGPTTTSTTSVVTTPPKPSRGVQRTQTQSSGIQVLERIKKCESKGDYRARNPRSTASGAYQYLDSTWRAYGYAKRYGVSRAYLATPAQQEEAAVDTYRRNGTRDWAASRGCWAR